MNHKQQNKRVAGVYLDNTKAVVIRPAPDYEEGDYIIQVKIDAEHHNRTSDRDSDNHAKQSDLLKYYKSVATLLHVYDELYIFDPSNVLKNNFRIISEKIHSSTRSILPFIVQSK